MIHQYPSKLTWKAFGKLFRVRTQEINVFMFKYSPQAKTSFVDLPHDTNHAALYPRGRLQKIKIPYSRSRAGVPSHFRGCVMQPSRIAQTQSTHPARLPQLQLFSRFNFCSTLVSRYQQFAPLSIRSASPAHNCLRRTTLCDTSAIVFGGLPAARSVVAQIDLSHTRSSCWTVELVNRLDLCSQERLRRIYQLKKDAGLAIWARCSEEIWDSF